MVEVYSSLLGQTKPWWSSTPQCPNFSLSSHGPSCVMLAEISWDTFQHYSAPFQYPIKSHIVRSHEVLKPRDLCLELSDCSEIWQAHQQHCCRCACQISKRWDKFNCQFCGFKTSRDLTIRCLLRYWNRALVSVKKLPLKPHRVFRNGKFDLYIVVSLKIIKRIFDWLLKLGAVDIYMMSS